MQDIVGAGPHSLSQLGPHSQSKTDVHNGHTTYNHSRSIRVMLLRGLLGLTPINMQVILLV